MDSNRFDAFARTLSSRRTALGHLLGGGLFAALGLQRTASEAAAAPCPKGKKRCKKRCIPRRQCCTTARCRPATTGKVCRRGRCVCRPGTKPCRGRCLHPAAACPPRSDAACPPGSGFPDPFTWMIRTAQTFTEPNGGRLTAAALWLSKTSAAVGTYELRLATVDPSTGEPQETTLALAQRPASEVSATFNWVSFTFPAPPRLEPGRQYALVLSMLGGTGTEGGIFEIQLNNPCPDGAFFQSDATGSFFPFPTRDIAYQTFVSP